MEEKNKNVTKERLRKRKRIGMTEIIVVDMMGPVEKVIQKELF